MTLAIFKKAIDSAAVRAGACFGVTLTDIEALGWDDFKLACYYATKCKVEIVIIPDKEYLLERSKVEESIPVFSN